MSEVTGESPSEMVEVNRLQAAAVFYEARYCCWESAGPERVLLCETHAEMAGAAK